MTNAKQQGSCGDRDKPDRASVVDRERDDKDHTGNAKLPSTDSHSTSTHPATATVNTEREHTANPMKKKFAYQLNQQAANISHNSDSSPAFSPPHPAQTEPTTTASTTDIPNTSDTAQGPDQSDSSAMALEEPACHSENSSITEDKAQTPTLARSIIAVPTPHTTTTTTPTAPATGTRIPLELGMSLAWYTTQSIDQLRRQQPDVYSDIVSDRERFDKWFLSKQRR